MRVIFYDLPLSHNTFVTDDKQATNRRHIVLDAVDVLQHSCSASKSRRVRKLQFTTNTTKLQISDRIHSCKFPTEGIMCVQNLNFAFKFLQNGLIFLPKIWHFWTKNFRQEEDFYTIFQQLKIKEATALFCPAFGHNVTD